MQNSRHQLIFRQYWSLAVAVLLFPMLLAGAIPILPTFDDWTTLVSPTPSDDVFFTKERFLFYGDLSTPFSAMF